MAFVSLCVNFLLVLCVFHKLLLLFAILVKLCINIYYVLINRPTSYLLNYLLTYLLTSILRTMFADDTNTLCLKLV